jgi:hypothetical protein
MPDVEAKLFVQDELYDSGTEERMRSVFESVVNEFGGDVVLMVYKPKYQTWIAAKMMMTAVKKPYIVMLRHI